MLKTQLLEYQAPGATEWSRFLGRLLLFLGAAWQDLDRFAKLGLLQSAVLVTALAAWRAGVDNILGQVALSLGVVFLVAFGFVFYYQLELTLLSKSATLLASGVALLALCGCLRRLPAPGEV